VFQVHGVDVDGQAVIRLKLKRRYVLAFFEKLPPCLIGMEACATSHHWPRELQALGHRVRLMPPAARPATSVVAERCSAASIVYSMHPGKWSQLSRTGHVNVIAPNT
jgi:hypothetical protein